VGSTIAGALAMPVPVLGVVVVGSLSLILRDRGPVMSGIVCEVPRPCLGLLSHWRGIYLRMRLSNRPPASPTHPPV